MPRWSKLGIIAGGGDLPVRLAQTCVTAGHDFYVIRLRSFVSEQMEQFAGEECGLGEMGKLIRTLKQKNCDAVVMAGQVKRPDFSALKPDWRGAALLPKAVAAARKGDGALLNVLVQTFESEGFLVIGAEEVSGDLFAPAGPLGALAPDSHDFRDMRKAADLIRVLGPFDIGQAAVVRNGLVLAVEAAEGTDAMLMRCRALPAEMKGFEPGEEEGRRGVLLKRPKPGQELRVDLPTIGVETIKQVQSAGLAGIAVEAEAALIIDQFAVAREADRVGVFVFGFSENDLDSP